MKAINEKTRVSHRGDLGWLVGYDGSSFVFVADKPKMGYHNGGENIRTFPKTDKIMKNPGNRCWFVAIDHVTIVKRSFSDIILRR